MFMKNTYYLSNKIKQLNIYIMKNVETSGVEPEYY